MAVSLAELFARDPREQSDEDFRLIVQGLREARHKFITEGTRALQPPKSPEARAVAKLDLDIKL